MKRVAVLLIVLGVYLAVPAVASAERYVGKTSQGKRIKLWTLSNGRLDFNLSFRANCEDKTYAPGAFYPQAKRRPKVRPSDNGFVYREIGVGNGQFGRHRFRFHMGGFVPDQEVAHGRFRLRMRFTDGVVCTARGTWEAQPR